MAARHKLVASLRPPCCHAQLHPAAPAGLHAAAGPAACALCRYPLCQMRRWLLTAATWEPQQVRQYRGLARRVSTVACLSSKIKREKNNLRGSPTPNAGAPVMCDANAHCTFGSKSTRATFLVSQWRLRSWTPAKQRQPCWHRSMPTEQSLPPLLPPPLLPVRAARQVQQAAAAQQASPAAARAPSRAARAVGQAAAQPSQPI